jgi:uncharacterized protein YbjT (DUF2867 family)
MVCMNHILVIGGTGTVGRQVLSRLAVTGAKIRAVARNPGAARFPPQVEVVRGDLTLPETLDSCLDGIDTVFLVWTAPAAVVAPALERIAQHAQRIVFLSAPIKTAAQSGQGDGSSSCLQSVACWAVCYASKRSRQTRRDRSCLLSRRTWR